MRAALLFLLVVPGAALAQMYKCVDEKGRTHYMDKPAPNCKGKEVDIRGNAPLSGQVIQQKGNVAADDAAFKRRQQQREAAEANDLAAKRRQEEQCARLGQEYGRLAGGVRMITKEGKDGERTYMDDAAREQRMAQLRQQMQKCP